MLQVGGGVRIEPDHERDGTRVVEREALSTPNRKSPIKARRQVSTREWSSLVFSLEQRCRRREWHHERSNIDAAKTTSRMIFWSTEMKEEEDSRCRGKAEGRRKQDSRMA